MTDADRDRILIVRHGEGRGREKQYLTPVLDYFRAHDPGLFGRLSLHATGAEPPDLDGVRAVLFWLGDPLKELYPDCYADACALADRASARGGIRLLNAPDALSNSIKTRQADLWREAGLLTPEHVQFESRDHLLELTRDLELPVLVKGDRVHGQSGMHLCHTRAALEALAPDALSLPGAVAEFVDTRAGWNERAPGSPYARYYHKKRIAIFGDVLHPRHVFFSDDPIVGLKQSILTGYARMNKHGTRKRKKGWNPPYHWKLLWHPEHRACIAEDWAYYQAEPEAPEVMRLAAKSLGLDFLALDYSTRADGRIVLWEANPYFWLPGPNTYILKRQRHFEERFHGFYGALREFFAGLLDPDGPESPQRRTATKSPQRRTATKSA